MQLEKEKILGGEVEYAEADKPIDELSSEQMLDDDLGQG